MMEADLEGDEIKVSHFMSGTVKGTDDESPAGTKCSVGNFFCVHLPYSLRLANLTLSYWSMNIYYRA